MAKTELRKYLEKVLKAGYPPKQVREQLVRKGFDRDDVEREMADAIVRLHAGNSILGRIASAFKQQFITKADRFIAKYAEKMFIQGYQARQIENVLADEGFDRARISKVVSIVEKSFRREEKLESAFGSMFRKRLAKPEAREKPEDIRYEINHFQLIKISIVVSIIIIAVLAMLLSRHIILHPYGWIEGIAPIAAILVALPVGAYIMHHISLRMNKGTVLFRDAIRYLGFMALLLLGAKAMFDVIAMLLALLIIIYFLANILNRNYELPVYNAYAIALFSIMSSILVAYFVMSFIGMLMGFYVVLL